MIKKPYLICLIIVILAIGGCVKETYDLKKLSKRAQLSPSLAISAAMGEISFDDILKPSDTVVFDQDKFIKIVFEDDSVIDFQLDDMYDFNDMIYFSRSYSIGEVELNPFNTVKVLTLRDVVNSFSEPYRSTFTGLDNTNSAFPAFPAMNLAETVFPPISNLEYATFSSGRLEFSLKNNIGAPLNGFSISLFNTTGHILIGTASSGDVIPDGATGIAVMDLTNKTVTNSVTAAVVLNGSDGNPVVSNIDLDLRNIETTVSGKDLVIESGRVILPSQVLTALNDTDSMLVDPGAGIELNEIKLNEGEINYNVISPYPVSGTVNLTFPTAIRNGIVLSSTIPVTGLMTSGIIPVDNTTINLGTDPLQPFNEIPVVYSFQISSGGNIVTFDKADIFVVTAELSDPDYDYVKGYFGKQTQTIGPEILDLEIDDILSHIQGDFLISNPSIRLNYSNSFSVPIKIDLQAQGKRDTRTVDLGLDTIEIDYPEYPERDITSSFLIDRNNSALPQLISMPPGEISFSGSAITNPSDEGSRDNYIFGDSRFLGSIEIEVPLELRFNNFQFADTIDNFMISDDPDGDHVLDPENFNMLRLDITAQNGFPLGASMSVSLYNPVTKTVIRTIDAQDLLKPAIVDANGKVTSPVESKTSILFTQTFFDDINKADQMIFMFRLNTSGTNAVKFYSDYSIKFNAALVLKPDIIIDLK